MPPAEPIRPLDLVLVALAAAAATMTAAQLEQALSRGGVTLGVHTRSGRIRLVKRLLASGEARTAGVERVTGPIPQPGLGRPALEGYRLADER
jgi:hypothetical protein